MIFVWHFHFAGFLCSLILPRRTVVRVTS